MENEVDNKFTWLIKNFLYLQSQTIYSEPLVVGGCKWRIKAYPKGNDNASNFSMFLEVVDSKSLPYGWRRHANFRFTIVNGIPNKLSQRREGQKWFEEDFTCWGFSSMFPLDKLYSKDSEYLIDGELKIAAEINVIEVIGKLDVPSTINGFQVLPSQVKYVNRLFERHPDIALKLRTNNKFLKTGYMNVLLGVIETMRQPLEKISKDDLADSFVAMESLVGVGFKLDWLVKKLHDMSEKKKKEEACESRKQELEKKLKDFEVLLKREKEKLDATRAP